MEYKPIENYHVENAILGKDFNLGATSFLFHAFTLMQVFLDDFNVYGDKKDHLEQLQKCLEKCRLNGINLNPEKCAFCVNLLGHIVCHDGLLVVHIRLQQLLLCEHLLI